MANPLQQRCNQLERSMRALHDECDRLMRENAMLRERMQRYGASQTVQRIDDELARIAAGAGEHGSSGSYVIHASSIPLY